MLFRALAIVLAALLAQSALAAGDTSCPAGKYLKKNPDSSNTGYTCTVCPAGQYTPSTNMLTSCMTCPAGQSNNGDHTGCVACTDGTYSGQGTSCQGCAAGKTSNNAHTTCDDCTGETYSTGGTTCIQCPAGQEINSGRTGCNKCQPGEYNKTPGQQCMKCPAGKFTSVQGAKSCCDCCAGFYASGTGNNSCKKCGDLNYTPKRRYSQIGSDSSSDCTSSSIGMPDYTETCNQPANNACPATTPGGPVGSPITRKRDMACTKGFTSCPRYSGRGGFDCVDTENDPEACGGCLGLDGSGSGTDCTAIQGTRAIRCIKGSCVIDSCRKGLVKSLDGTSCVSPRLGGLHAQDSHANKMDRSSAKRVGKKKPILGKGVIRANIY